MVRERIRGRKPGAFTGDLEYCFVTDPGKRRLCKDCGAARPNYTKRSKEDKD